MERRTRIGPITISYFVVVVLLALGRAWQSFELSSMPVVCTEGPCAEDPETLMVAGASGGLATLFGTLVVGAVAYFVGRFLWRTMGKPKADGAAAPPPKPVVKKRPFELPGKE